MDTLIQKNCISVQWILHWTALTVCNVKYQDIMPILYFRCSFGTSPSWPYFPFWLEQRVLHAHGGRCMCLASKSKNSDDVYFLCAKLSQNANCPFAISIFCVVLDFQWCRRFSAKQQIFLFWNSHLILIKSADQFWWTSIPEQIPSC